MSETTGKTQPKQQQKAVETPDEEPRVSKDARFSTYKEASADDLDNADEQVKPGRHVVQEPGEPSEGEGNVFNAKRGGS